MQSKHIIVGTAGHVDHGKSTLVEVLTGTNPDRLEEEKRRGITIDLGFAFLKMGDVEFGFVDVPGHERFVRNMLAGVGGIDLVLLVIAADESIKPQTREHFEICRLLGISRGLIAITKSDLVPADMLGLVRLEVEDFVRSSFLEGAPIVTVSAKTGMGLDALKLELSKAAGETTAKKVSGHLRLPIDRSFALKGFGTVVTGTLVSGSLKIEDEVEITHPTRRVRVRGLHSGGESIKRAVAGQRTAVNLAGIDHHEAQRGMVLTVPGIFKLSTRLDARIELLRSARPLKSHSRVHFHQGTAETVAEVVLLQFQELAPGCSTLAQLRLDSPVLLLPGDCFILRQFSPVVTIGGGVVIDAQAIRHRSSDLSLLPFLETLERGTHGQILTGLTQRSSHPLTVTEIMGRTGWMESEVLATITSLAAEKRVRILGDQPLRIASSQSLADCAAAIRKALEEFHRSNPLVPGISREELRGRVGGDAGVFDVSVSDLVSAHLLSVSRDLIQRAGRQIDLSPEEAKAKTVIEAEFKSAGLKVPSFSVVLQKLPIESRRAQKILQILLREKVLIKVADDLVFHRATMDHLRALLASQKQEKGARLPIPVFKELTGVTRKYAIPLLEYLDREHVTRRAGDERVIL